MTEDAAQSTDAILVVDVEDREFVEQVAAEQGVEVVEIEKDGFIDPLSISLMLLGGAAAIATVTYLVDRRKGGQVFDLRPGAPRLAYRSKGVVYGLVMIIAIDGSAKVEVHEPRGMFGEVIDALTKIITDLAKAGIGDIVHQVTAAVPATASVTVTPVPA